LRARDRFRQSAIPGFGGLRDRTVHLCLRQVLQQHPRSQALADLEGLRHARRLRLQETAGQPLEDASPLAQKRRPALLALLAAPQTFDRVEGLERLRDSRVLRQRAPRERQARLPRIRQQYAVASAPRQRHGFAAQSLGTRRVALRVVLREQPQAGGAHPGNTKREGTVETAAKVRGGATGIADSQQIAQGLMRLGLDQRGPKLTGLRQHRLGFLDQRGPCSLARVAFALRRARH